MIGQESIQSRLNAQIENNTLPRCMLFIGADGSGRTTLAEVVAKKLNAQALYIDIKADAIRNMIEQAYKIASKVVYIIRNADSMSVTAQNTLLKITEEPPNNAYFIITLKDASFILETIRSRATTFMLDVYTQSQLYSFISDDLREQGSAILKICSTPGEIEQFRTIDIKAFKRFVTLVVDSIAEVSGANAFKISQSIAFSDSADATQYNLQLFWKAFIVECKERLFKHPDKIETYSKGIMITAQYLNKANIPSLNKASLFDMWIFDIRREWW